MPRNILIIGAGEIGLAINSVLSRKGGLAINLWDKDKSKVPKQKELKDLASTASVIFICVPSWALREVVNNIKQYLNKDSIIVSLSKGLELDTNKTADKILIENLPVNQPLAIMGGPMIAEEISVGGKGIGVLSSNSIATFKEIETLFSNTNIEIEYTDDLHGVALAGVLKNIYAIILGIVHGLGMINEKQNKLAEKAIKEMANVAELLGAKKETIYGNAGKGDFLKTAFSDNSRNHQAGIAIAKTGECSIRSEGTISLPSVIKLIDANLAKFPLIKTLNEVIEKRNDPKVFLEFADEK